MTWLFAQATWTSGGAQSRSVKPGPGHPSRVPLLLPCDCTLRDVSLALVHAFRKLLRPAFRSGARLRRQGTERGRRQPLVLERLEDRMLPSVSAQEQLFV